MSVTNPQMEEVISPIGPNLVSPPLMFEDSPVSVFLDQVKHSVPIACFGLTCFTWVNIEMLFLTCQNFETI